MKKTEILLFIIFCSCKVTANSPSFAGYVKGDSLWKLPVEDVEIVKDTLFVNTNDFYIQYPFGEYTSMAEFKKHNAWTSTLSETKFFHPVYKKHIYCYCDSLINICLWESHYWANDKPKTVEYTAPITIVSDNIMLVHNIRIGMLKSDFLSKIDIDINNITCNVSVIAIYSMDDEHYYFFTDNALSKIVIAGESQLKEYKCK